MASRVRGTTVDISSLIAGFEKMLGIKESLARSMALPMGVEVRDEAKLRAPVLDPQNMGTDQQQAGLLKESIYVAYDARANVLNPSAYRYAISWNSKKAPHGHLIEFGHWLTYEYARTAQGLFYTPLPGVEQREPFWVDQQAFLGPAFDAKLPRLASIAFQAGTIKFAELMK